MRIIGEALKDFNAFSNEMDRPKFIFFRMIEIELQKNETHAIIVLYETTFCNTK